MQTYDSMLDSCSVLPQDGMTSAPSLEAARMGSAGAQLTAVASCVLAAPIPGKVSKPCTVQKSVRLASISVRPLAKMLRHSAALMCKLGSNTGAHRQPDPRQSRKASQSPVPRPWPACLEQDLQAQDGGCALQGPSSGPRNPEGSADGSPLAGPGARR